MYAIRSYYVHLGIAYARSGSFDRAVELLKELIGRRPDAVIASLVLARLYRETGLELLAEEEYRRILSLNPGFEPATVELAGLCEKRGEIDAALAVYRRALRITSYNVCYTKLLRESAL